MNNKNFKLLEIAYKMNDSISSMQSMDNKDAVAFIGTLENHIEDYFLSNKSDDLKLKKELVQVVDALYVALMELEIRNLHVDVYFEVVAGQLFREMAKLDLFAFFIVDNSLRDDRFKLLVELFKIADFEVIHPYQIETITYSDEYTRYKSMDYEKIQKQIDQAVKNKKHVIYVEKDDSVNYLKEILHLGEEMQSKYSCVFRNESIEKQKTAKWLMGSFGDILK